MEYNVGYPSGMPLGGIGTGLVELQTNGKPGALLVNNNWAQPLLDVNGCFFALNLEKPDGTSEFIMLQREDCLGYKGVPNVRYSGLFPVAKVEYFSPNIPMRMEVAAFSPLVPHNTEKSNFPGVIFNFKFKNFYSTKVKLTLFVSWENTLGCGGLVEGPTDCNRTGNYIIPSMDKTYNGINFKTTMEGKEVYPNSLGDYALLTPVNEKVCFSSYGFNTVNELDKVLFALSVGQSFDKFNVKGIEGTIHPAGIIGMGIELKQYEECVIPVAFTWYTPYHQVITYKDEKTLEILKQYAPLYEEDVMVENSNDASKDYGHFYQNRYSSAIEVASDLLTRRKELLNETTALHRFMLSSGLPKWLTSKILNDSNPLVANTVLTKSGILSTLEASRGMGGALGTMDQRLASHAAYQLFYPELNRTEMQLFADIQSEDGHITHFCGNFYENIGSCNVSYGDTTWPDLSCSFIIQCYRDLMCTGDYKYFNKMLPHILKAYEWLKSADKDGDSIPEGGSSWDTEHHGGLFVYTGSLWLATLRIIEKIAAMEQNNEIVEEACQLFKNAQENFIKSLWNGEYFNCVNDVSTGYVSDEIFSGQLAGEWVVSLLGLESILPVDMMKKTLKTIYKFAGNKEMYKLIPIITKRDGTLVGRDMDEQAWPQYILLFLDCLSLYLGMYDDGMENIKCFNECVCELSKAPYTTTLWHDCRTGMPNNGGRLDRYMNCSASWFVLNSLSGFHHDEIENRIILGPVLGTDKSKVKIPLISTSYWAMMDTEIRTNTTTLNIEFSKLFSSLKLKGLKLRGETKSLSITHNSYDIEATFKYKNGYTIIDFNKLEACAIKENDILYIEYTM